MARRPRLSDASANVAADVVCALLNAGRLAIYNGDQPESANDPVGRQTLLATVQFTVPAFRAAKIGVATAYPMGAELAVASGTATWFRAYSSSDTTIFDGSVGTSDDFDLILNTVLVQAGARVSVAGFTYMQEKA